LAVKYGALLYPFFLEGVAEQSSLNMSDGIHPNREGVEAMVQRILPDVEKLLGKT
jgi:acyl-CoA thioesterase-1